MESGNHSEKQADGLKASRYGVRSLFVVAHYFRDHFLRSLPTTSKVILNRISATAYVVQIRQQIMPTWFVSSTIVGGAFSKSIRCTCRPRIGTFFKSARDASEHCDSLVVYGGPESSKS